MTEKAIQNGAFQVAGREAQPLDVTFPSRKLGTSIRRVTAEMRVEGWAQRLLDLSKANRLLNVHDTAMVVPLVCPHPALLEDALAADQDFKIRSCEGHEGCEAGRCELWSALSQCETDRRLKELFRASRGDLEESGVNTLFLVLGVLEWYEPGHDHEPFRAPILLVPVGIGRQSIAGGYRIRRTDEETTVNTTLLEFLRREYRLTIPGLDPLPADESGVDVVRIFDVFRTAVRDVKGLLVSEDCMIGRFSFCKFVMWKDLTEHMEAVRSNPLVSHLIARNGLYDDGIEVFPAGEVGRHFDYSRVCCPLSADASQLTAVIYSGLGKSFVLHGPPGTGKSQTIANIIAHNLSLGRRVLFVAEKKAALEVVYGRLAKLGLAPFCLQLHSNKAGKAETYAQFAEVLKFGMKVPPHGWATVVAETEALRGKLDGYVRALHRQTPSGFTPYELFTKLVRSEIDGDGSPIACPARETTNADYERAKSALAVAAEMRRGIPAEAVKALACVRPFAWTPREEARVATEAARLARDVEAAAEAVKAFGGSFEKDAKCLERYFALLEKRRSFEERLRGTYDVSGLRRIPVKDVRRRLNGIAKAFLPVRIFKECALLRELASVVSSGKLDRVSLGEVVRLAQELREIDTAVMCHEGEARKLLDEGFNREMANPVTRMEARAEAERRFEKAMGELVGLVDIDPAKVDASTAVKMAEGVAVYAKGNLRHAFMYYDARQRIPAVAQEVALRLDGDDHPVAGEWVARFEHSFQSKLLNEVMETEPEFGSFFGRGREMDIARFRELDEQCSRLSLDNLIARLAQAVPVNDGKPRRGDRGELGLLMHECGKKTRQKPIRQILAETQTLIPAIKPCFLMSPLSAAQYLPLDAKPFDLVVFDEASQIPVWDAIGVIARGRQLVVVGDPKQLPPTSFFQKGLDEEEAAEDLESVLDECLHAGFMSCFLDWHYRSRHESLIAYSNHRYYGNRLHVFPAAVQSDRTGVSFVHVPDGVYEARGRRINRREAEVVADQVVQYVQDPGNESKSIGVVAFSEAQRNLIEDILDERRAANSELERKFSAQGDEGFFVKNLENVQGDERDVIVFSIGYAPDATGRFNMVFGPLGNQGGERRLNVAITRAREKIVVVSSIHGQQIDTSRVNTQGPADLRAFLEYAEKGRRIALPHETPVGDGFADEVAEVLEKAGAKVVRGVGFGGVRVDVAICDPADEARYALGVMCDGRGYAAELTTRDRDRLRNDVLVSLGWNILHVWIVDWAYDRTAAEKRLKDAFGEAMNKKRANA